MSEISGVDREGADGGWIDFEKSVIKVNQRQKIGEKIDQPQEVDQKIDRLRKVDQKIGGKKVKLKCVR